MIIVIVSYIIFRVQAAANGVTVSACFGGIGDSNVLNADK